MHSTLSTKQASDLVALDFQGPFKPSVQAMESQLQSFAKSKASQLESLHQNLTALTSTELPDLGHTSLLQFTKDHQRQMQTLAKIDQMKKQLIATLYASKSNVPQDPNFKFVHGQSAQAFCLNVRLIR